jgi:putative ABC transport system permease protein
MRLRTLIARELAERPVPVAACALVILLGVAALVAAWGLAAAAERAVARELDALGANVLILPRGVSLQDYYAADLHGEVLPEEYVTRLALSGVQGVDNLSPKLCVPAALAGRTVALTGILPRSEFQAKAAWQGAGIFARPAGCGAVDVPGGDAHDPAALARKRVIETLGEAEALVGADVAGRTCLKEGDSVELLGERFAVLAVLPPTGTVDDSRVFAHLHTVQRLAGRGEVVNVIEVVGCCKQIAGGLVERLTELLPEAKVVTITQVVRTQVAVNRLLGRLTLGLLAGLVVVGGVSVAAAMHGNVRERRREIGTFVALGATPGLVLRLFLGKAAALGLAGGLGGSLLGSALAVYLGPQLAGGPVWPPVLPAAYATALAVAVVLGATYLPARRASRLDPCSCLREV